MIGAIFRFAGKTIEYAVRAVSVPFRVIADEIATNDKKKDSGKDRKSKKGKKDE